MRKKYLRSSFSVEAEKFVKAITLSMKKAANVTAAVKTNSVPGLNRMNLRSRLHTYRFTL